MPDTPRVLPKVILSGIAYFVDERLQELRAVDNAHEAIRFREFETALSLAVITAKHAEPRDPPFLLDVFNDAIAYDTARGGSSSDPVREIVAALKQELAEHKRMRARRVRERVP